jgi:hypothetical protein
MPGSWKRLRDRRWGIRVQVGAVGFVLLVLASVLAGCGGGGRSTQAFCSTLHQGTAQLRAGAQHAVAQSRQNALVGLVDAFGSVGDFEGFLDRLNKVAPPPIEGDMNTVDGDFHNAISNSGSAAAGLLLGDPTGLAKILFDELIHVNSYRHVDQFAAQNCGTQIFGA